MLGDPRANPGAFGSGKLVARRQCALVVSSAHEGGAHALDLLPLALQGSPFLSDHRNFLASRASKTGAAPQHANSTQCHDPADPIGPVHRFAHAVKGLIIDGDCELNGSHQHEKETKNEARTSAYSAP